MNKPLALGGLAILAFAAPVAAQEFRPSLFGELRGGGVIPTFRIADVATPGASFGATIGYNLTPRWVLMGEFDYGMHEDEPSETVDINTLHFMGKLGYSLTGPRDRGWEAVVNLGAGAVTFDVEGADQNSYFAINAGAKLTYHVNPAFALVLSPQGDIAFSRKSELTTTNAWVWPITTGLRVKF